MYIMMFHVEHFSLVAISDCDLVSLCDSVVVSALIEGFEEVKTVLTWKWGGFKKCPSK